MNVKVTAAGNGNYKPAAKTVPVKVSVSYSAKPKITAKERNAYYGKSAFIGSSIGVGQRMYFERQGAGYLGGPVMLVRGCYAFHNDKGHVSKYMLHFRGQPMQAKYAVKAANVDRVFIAMGTNDFIHGIDQVYQDYVDYVEGIRKVNPMVVIFIESTTGVTRGRQGKTLNSRNVAELNRRMKKYCSKHKVYNHSYIAPFSPRS